MQLTSSAHCVYNLKIHLVFVVAYRRKEITAEILSELQKLSMVLCHSKGAELLEFSGESVHVHLLLSIRPSTQISDLVRVLKSVSSLEIRRKHSHQTIRHLLWGKRFWTQSYCVISVGDGASTEVIKRYIQSQIQPH